MFRMPKGILRKGENSANEKTVQIDSKTNYLNPLHSLTQSWIRSNFSPTEIAKNRQAVAQENYQRQFLRNTQHPIVQPVYQYVQAPGRHYVQQPVQVPGRQPVYVQAPGRHYVQQPVQAHARHYVQQQPVHHAVQAHGRHHAVQPGRGVPSSSQIYQRNGQFYINPDYKANNNHAYAHGGKRTKKQKSKQNKKITKKKT